jgi:hypothetical protein
MDPPSIVGEYQEVDFPEEPVANLTKEATPYVTVS